jgi:molybdopterin molybdotransferase
MRREGKPAMISVEHAVSAVTSSFTPRSSELIPISSALGRVLAEDVACQVTQPPTDVSAMDGYAVRVEDIDHVPATLRIVGESAAGNAFQGIVESGRAVRISTGAAMPQGANAIVIQENTDRSGDALTVKEMPVARKWIREAGLDFRVGTVLLRDGRLLTARDIGLCAAMNAAWVRVYRKPVVAFLATGNELVLPGAPVGPNQIVNSNSAALAASIAALGGIPVNLGIAGDTESSLVAKLQELDGMDLLITTGGASVGDHDLVLSVLEKLGLQLLFHKVAMRPGKPILFGRLGAIPVLGLPGNPVSVGVATAVLLRPAMEVMLGIAQGGPEPATARLTRDLAGNDERQDYLRARLSRDEAGATTVSPLGKQDSSMMAAFAEADCLIVRAPHAPPAAAGDPVEYLPLAHGTLSL